MNVDSTDYLHDILTALNGIEQTLTRMADALDRVIDLAGESE